MTDTQLAHLSVLAALNKMMHGQHFSICTLDEAVKALGTVPEAAAYRILRPLHCVSWMDMPRELRDAVPKLIERCVQIPAYQFQITEVTPDVAARVQSGSLLTSLTAPWLTQPGMPSAAPGPQSVAL